MRRFNVIYLSSQKPYFQRVLMLYDVGEKSNDVMSDKLGVYINGLQFAP